MLLGSPIRQIAYFVHDVRTAAKRHMSTFGSGPYFVMEFPPLMVMHRGISTPFDQTAAVGQWGAIQVEFLQQNDDGPSILHDLYPPASGRTGLHHVAMFVDSLESTVAAFAEAGHAEVTRISPAGIDATAVFIDTVNMYGHFVEIYERARILTDLYDTVAAAAVDFDGRDPVRTLKYTPSGQWQQVEV